MNEFEDFIEDLTPEDIEVLKNMPTSGIKGQPLPPIKSLEKELIKDLLKALEEAIDWAAYADEYFQEKYNLAAQIENIKNLQKRCRDIVR